MWNLFKKNETPNPPKTWARETTFAKTNIVRGTSHTIVAGVHEGPEGLFSPWVWLYNVGYYYPKRIPMTRHRAERAAHHLGQAQEIVALLSRDQLLEQEHDRPHGRDELQQDPV